MQQYSIQPQFIDSVKGKLFCNYIVANNKADTEHAVLILPPFAEEMNKSRHMIANMAHKSASHGYNVLIFDLFGTGDSQGDFGESSWETWLEDIGIVLDWLYNKNIKTVTIIALRTGALFAESILHNVKLNIDKLIFWQPVSNGGLFLNQFIRLKLAADMVADSKTRISAKDIKLQLENGESVEIAGYMLNPALFIPMTEQKITELKQVTCPDIHWYEVAPSLEQTFTPASMRVIDELKASGLTIQTRPLQGPQFWSTAEITEVPMLLSDTLTILQGR